MKDLVGFEFDRSLIIQDNSIHTPLYLMTTDSGGHTFHKQCPNCKTAFPKFSPPTDELIDNAIQRLPKQIDVCLIERLSEACLRLMIECKQRGALIMFEPNRIEKPALLAPLLKWTDIVKYSEERIPLLAGLEKQIEDYEVRVEIQTLGSEGIRFRTVPKRSGKWIIMPSLECDNFADASGAGDWTTARFIHELLRKNDYQAAMQEIEQLESIIQQAQAEAALNCAFPAPRGRMYSLEDFPVCGLPCEGCLQT